MVCSVRVIMGVLSAKTTRTGTVRILRRALVEECLLIEQHRLHQRCCTREHL